MTKKELQKENRQKIVSLTNELTNKLNNLTNIDEQSRNELLFCVAEIKSLCISHSEALRLAGVIANYIHLTDKQKAYFSVLKIYNNSRNGTLY